MAKQRSLVAEADAPAQSEPVDANVARYGAVMDVFDQPAADIAVVDDGGATAYATFISTKSKLWGDLARQLPGLEEPDVVLVRPKPLQPLRLTPFRFGLLTAKQYWADIDEEGALLKVWLDKPAYNQAVRVSEVIEAMVLAYHEDGVHAARMTFKTTKCGAAKTAIAALKMASMPEWGTQSKQHEETLRLPKPYMRFVATVSCKRVTSRSSGYAYWRADASIAPLTPDFFGPLAAFFGDPGNLKELSLMHEGHMRRLAEVEAVAKKTR